MSEWTPLERLFDLSGKVALVTGGGQGIGEAIAGRLAEARAQVVVADLKGDTAQRTAQRIVQRGGRAVAKPLDVSDLEGARAAVDAIRRSEGGIDILVNNAGIFPFSPIQATTPELWRRVLDVNLSGAFFLSQAAIAGMAGGSAIVNIASIDAFRPTGGLAHYDASKAGLAMLTRSLAFELGQRGIRVNTVAPGSINTPGAGAASAAALPSGMDPAALIKSFLARIPLGRMGEPEDIANAVLYLASPASSYVTGATLIVDGGYLVA